MLKEMKLERSRRLFEFSNSGLMAKLEVKFSGPIVSLLIIDLEKAKSIK